MKINNFIKISECKVWTKRKKKARLTRSREQDVISLQPYQVKIRKISECKVWSKRNKKAIPIRSTGQYLISLQPYKAKKN